MLRVMALAICLGATNMLFARATVAEEPIITMTTSIYELAGANNQISLVESIGRSSVITMAGDCRCSD